MVEALSKHFAEGRLDQAEFDERSQRAMAAKTRGDLAGLFDDLPPVVPESGTRAETGRRRRGGLVLAMVIALIFLAAFSSAAWAWHFPWLLFALIFFFVWFRARGGWHHHHHSHRTWQGPPAVTETEGSGPGGPWWAYSRRRWWM